MAITPREEAETIPKPPPDPDPDPKATFGEEDYHMGFNYLILILPLGIC